MKPSNLHLTISLICLSLFFGKCLAQKTETPSAKNYPPIPKVKKLKWQTTTTTREEDSIMNMLIYDSEAILEGFPVSGKSVFEKHKQDYFKQHSEFRMVVTKVLKGDRVQEGDTVSILKVFENKSLLLGENEVREICGTERDDLLDGAIYTLAKVNEIKDKVYPYNLYEKERYLVFANRNNGEFPYSEADYYTKNFVSFIIEYFEGYWFCGGTEELGDQIPFFDAFYPYAISFYDYLRQFEGINLPPDVRQPLHFDDWYNSESWKKYRRYSSDSLRAEQLAAKWKAQQDSLRLRDNEY